MSEVKEVQENNIPLNMKMLLSLDEAARYSGIGIHKLRELCNREDCNFSLKNGKKTMIKRAEFEEFISSARDI